MSSSNNDVVVVCSEIADPNWRWIEASLDENSITFRYAPCSTQHTIDRLPFLNMARLRGSLEAVLLAKKSGAKAIVTHGPTLAAWCALFARLLGVKTKILAHSFNFTELPSRIKRAVFSVALSNIDRFVVFSSVERGLYAEAFKLPPQKFDVVLWGVRPPEADDTQAPIEKEDYICAIGGNARDYKTLIHAARRLPNLTFVLVVRPESIQGLDLPPNVKKYVDLPYLKTMNVLKHSKFMVLPLLNSTVPCGHVTLVAAMYFKKAFIVTDSLGVRDYVTPGFNGLTIGANSVDDLVSAIENLWRDSTLCNTLSENGLAFAVRECAEKQIADHFVRWLRSF